MKGSDEGLPLKALLGSSTLPLQLHVELSSIALPVTLDAECSPLGQEKKKVRERFERVFLGFVIQP